MLANKLLPVTNAGGGALTEGLTYIGGATSTTISGFAYTFSDFDIGEEHPNRRIVVAASCDGSIGLATTTIGTEASPEANPSGVNMQPTGASTRSSIVSVSNILPTGSTVDIAVFATSAPTASTSCRIEVYAWVLPDNAVLDQYVNSNTTLGTTLPASSGSFAIATTPSSGTTYALAWIGRQGDPYQTVQLGYAEIPPSTSVTSGIDVDVNGNATFTSGTTFAGTEVGGSCKIASALTSGQGNAARGYFGARVATAVTESDMPLVTVGHGYTLNANSSLSISIPSGITPGSVVLVYTRAHANPTTYYTNFLDDVAGKIYASDGTSNVSLNTIYTDSGSGTGLYWFTYTDETVIKSDSATAVNGAYASFVIAEITPTLWLGNPTISFIGPLISYLRNTADNPPVVTDSTYVDFSTAGLYFGSPTFESPLSSVFFPPTTTNNGSVGINYDGTTAVSAYVAEKQGITMPTTITTGYVAPFPVGADTVSDYGIEAIQENDVLSVTGVSATGAVGTVTVVVPAVGPSLVNSGGIADSGTISFGSMTSGDIAFVSMRCDDSHSYNIPTGWTEVKDDSGAAQNAYMIWREYTGSSIDLDLDDIFTGTTDKSVAWAVFSGIDMGTIVETPTLNNYTTGSSGMPNPPSYSPPAESSLVLLYGGLDDDAVAVVTAPSGFTMCGTANSTTGSPGSTCMMAYAIYEGGVTPLDPAAFGGSGSDNWSSFVVTVEPV